ncbi:uncharacterized protein LOC144908192 [Branchiostoma floridae x Branchiostoma belcheri]
MAETTQKPCRLSTTLSSAVKTAVTDSVAVKLVLDGEIADDVVLRGSWDGWSRDWDLKRNKKKLENSVCLDLPCGYYEYKYRGGRRWFCDKSKPMVPNVFGTLNNYMEVRKVPETSSAIVQGLRSKTSHINVKIQKNVDLEVLRSKGEATHDETPVIDTDKRSKDADATKPLTQAEEFEMVIDTDGNLEGRVMTKSITEEKVQMEAIVSGTEFFQANPTLPILVLPTVEKKPYDKDDFGTTTKDEAKNASQDMEKTPEAEPTTEESLATVTEEADIRPGPDLVANIEEKVSAQMTTTKKTADRPVPDLVKNTDGVPSETPTSNTDESDSWGIIDVSEESKEPAKTIGDIVQPFDDNAESGRAESGEKVHAASADIDGREEGEVVSATSSDLFPTEGNEEPAKTIGDIDQPFDDNAQSERAEEGEAVQGASTDIDDREKGEVVLVTLSDLVPTEGNEEPAKTIGDIVQPFDDNTPSERAEEGEAVQGASTDIGDREEDEVVLVTSSDLVPIEGNKEPAKAIGDIVLPFDDNEQSERAEEGEAVQGPSTNIDDREEGEVVSVTSSGLVPTEGNEEPAKAIGDIVQPFDDKEQSERAEEGEAVQETFTDIDDREEGEVVSVTSSDLFPTEGNEEPAKAIGDIVQPFDDNAQSERAEPGESVKETSTDIGDREEDEVVLATSSDLVPTEGNEEPAKAIGDIVQPLEDNTPSEKAVQETFTDIGEGEEEVVLITSSDDPTDEGTDSDEECYELVLKMMGIAEGIQDLIKEVPGVQAPILHTTDQTEDVSTTETPIPDKTTEKAPCTTEKAQAQDEPSSQVTPDTTQGSKEALAMATSIKVEISEKDFPESIATTSVKIDSAEAKVVVKGSWDGWSKAYKLDRSANGVYSVTLMLPAGLHEYKFRLGNKWFHNDTKPVVPNVFGTLNNYLEVGKLPDDGLTNQDQGANKVAHTIVRIQKEIDLETIHVAQNSEPKRQDDTGQVDAKMQTKVDMEILGASEYECESNIEQETEVETPVHGTEQESTDSTPVPVQTENGGCILVNTDRKFEGTASIETAKQNIAAMESVLGRMEVLHTAMVQYKTVLESFEDSEDDGDLSTTTDVEPGGQKYEDRKSLEDNSFTDEVSLAMHDGQKPIPNEQPEQKAFAETTESDMIIEKPVSGRVNTKDDFSMIVLQEEKDDAGIQNAIEESENNLESNDCSAVSDNETRPNDTTATKVNLDIVEMVQSTTITSDDNTAAAETPPADDMATKGNAEKTVKNTTITEISAPDDNTAAAETAQPAEASVLEKTDDETSPETLASDETLPGDNQMPNNTTVTKTTTSDDPPEKNLSEFAEKLVDGTVTEPARSTDAAMLECIDVKLVWKGATSGDVVLQGSWDGWRRAYKLNKSDQGEYSMSLKLPFGQHEYKFRVGKSWIEDETKPTVPNVFGTQNNILKVPDIPETDNKIEETKPTDETILKQTSYAEEAETTYTVRPQTEDTTEDKPTTEALLEEQNMNDSFSTEAQTSDKTTGDVNSVNAIKGEETTSTGKETKEQVHDTGLGVLETLADKLSTEICQSVEGVMKTIQDVNEKSEDRVYSSSPSEDSKTAEEVVLDTRKKSEVTTETTTEGGTAKKAATDIVGVVKRNQQAEKMVEETTADFAEDTATEDAIDTLSSEEILKNNLQDIAERSGDRLYCLNQPEEPTETVAKEVEEVLPDDNPEVIPTNAAPSDEIDLGVDLYEGGKQEEKTYTEVTVDETSTNTPNKTQDAPYIDLPAPDETAQITNKLQTAEDTDATEASPAEKTANASSDDKGTTVEPLGGMIENITPDDFTYNAEPPSESEETITDEVSDTETRSPLPEIREEESEDEAATGKSSGQRRVKITLHDCSHIKLLWHGETGGDVFLQGSWDGWTQSHKLKKGDYSVTLKLPVGLHEYKFRIGNSWFHDKAKTTVLNCWNTPNNVINVT